MATAKKPFDWDDSRKLRERAWNSVKEFFGKEEGERPLNPELVSEASLHGGEEEEDLEDPTDPNAKRIHRPTEQRSINENPSIWPG